MKKEFKRLSRKDLREISLYFRGYKVDRAQFETLVVDQKSEFQSLLKISGSWGCLYDLPLVYTVIGMFSSVGQQDQLMAALISQEPEQALLSLIDSDDETLELGDEDKALFIAFVMALIGTMEALESYSLTMQQLLEKGLSDDEFFLRAVLTDRAVVQASAIADRVALAQLTGDETFLNALSKAITRTKPRPQRKEFDETRFILRVLDDAVGLTNLKNADLDQLLSDELGSFPGNNSYDRISKLLTETRNRLRK